MSKFEFFMVVSAPYRTSLAAISENPRLLAMCKAVVPE